MIMPFFLKPRGVHHEIYMIYPRQVEALRRKELEMVVDLREQLEQKKESEEREESALRSMEAQQRLLQEAEVNIISNLD